MVQISKSAEFGEDLSLGDFLYKSLVKYHNITPYCNYADDSLVTQQHQKTWHYFIMCLISDCFNTTNGVVIIHNSADWIMST